MANAISDLKTNLEALGCTCPPLIPTVDPTGPSTTFQNTSASCTITLSLTGSDGGGPWTLAPGQTFDYNAFCWLNFAFPPSGTGVFHIGGGVDFTVKYS